MLERRKFLGSVGTVAVTGLAGCSSTSTDADSNRGQSDSTENQSATDDDEGPTENTQRPQIISPTEDRISSFGTSVAASGNGNTAIVGADGDNSAYVFGNDGGEWAQQAKLVPDDGDTGDLFGHSVDISNDGTIALIGSYSDKASTDYNAGSVYVFIKSNNGWNEQTKITPEDNNRVQFFGTSVALTGDGTTAVVGAPDTWNSNDEPLGATYVFSNTNQGWMQENKLTPNNPNTDSDSNEFGASVAISEDSNTVVIGDPGGGSGISLAGRAYTFVKEQGEWRQQDKYKANDTNRADQFGNSVSVTDAGNTAIIGAFHNNEGPSELKGSAYEFEINEQKWDQNHKFSSPSTGDSEFGGSVDISGDGSISLIGAYGGQPGGAAYVYTQSENGWSRISKLPRNDSSNFRTFNTFSKSLALSNDGSTAFVGNNKIVGDERDPQFVGNVYIYTL